MASNQGKSFAKAKTMLSAKNQVAIRKQNELADINAKFIGEPPANQVFLHCRLVLPGGHRIPHGLDDPGALDGIRREHQIWITRPEPNILDLSSSSMSCLQAGLKAVNWAIHDMRLSNEHPITRFFVQMPTKAAADASIKFELRSRPQVEVKSPPYPSVGSCVERLSKQMGEMILQEAENLMALGKDLTMRVNFGVFNVRQKKKGIGNDFSYDKFGDIIKMYSLRGGASLETRLSGAQAAENILQRLTDPRNGIFLGTQDVDYGCNLTLVCQENELRANLQMLGGQNTQQLSVPTMTTPELSARLNWTTCAPDMAYDWNLRVDAWEAADTPTELSSLMGKISLKFDSIDSAGSLMSLKFPQIQMRKPGIMGAQVSQTRLQMTATVPYRDTPWVVEIGITKVWKGLDTTAQPEVYWGAQVYGVHWEGEINAVEVGGRRKVWGPNLEYIWPGDSTEEAFKSFLESIVTIQAELDGGQEPEESLL